MNIFIRHSIKEIDGNILITFIGMPISVPNRTIKSVTIENTNVNKLKNIFIPPPLLQIVVYLQHNHITDVVNCQHIF